VALWSSLRAAGKAEVSSSTLPLQLSTPGAERTARIYIQPTANDMVQKQSKYQCNELSGLQPKIGTSYNDRRDKIDPFFPFIKTCRLPE